MSLVVQKLMMVVCSLALHVCRERIGCYLTKLTWIVSGALIGCLPYWQQFVERRRDEKCSFMCKMRNRSRRWWSFCALAPSVRETSVRAGTKDVNICYSRSSSRYWDSPAQYISNKGQNYAYELITLASHWPLNNVSFFFRIWSQAIKKAIHSSFQWNHRRSFYL